MKKQSNTIAITPSYQWVFVGGVLGGWALSAMLLAHQMASNYTSAGSWLYMCTIWLFPIVIFLASLGFAYQKYALQLQRFFFSTMLTAVVMSIYGVIQWLDNDWYTTVYTRHHPLAANASYWQSFGNTWVVMLLTLVAYVGCLLWIRGKRK